MKPNIASIITQAKKAEYERILAIFQNSDSACAEWAIGLIESAQRGQGRIN